MKRWKKWGGSKAGVSLEEVFADSEKEPGWKEACAKARIEVRMAIQISRARKKAKMTQKTLAKKIGTTQSVVSRIEQANQNLTLSTLSKIAEALHGNLDIQLNCGNATYLGRKVDA